MELIRKPENPAKTYLRRYRALVIQRESLQRSIDAAYDRATNITPRIKEINVQGSGASDKMAEAVAQIADEAERLKAAKQRVDAALADVLTAINAVQDEMQRTVLLLRYVEGLEWQRVAEQIHYEIANTYILHGRALWAVRKWMEATGK